MDILRKGMIFVLGCLAICMAMNSCSSIGNLFYRRQPLRDREPYTSSRNEVKRFLEKSPLQWRPGYIADSTNRLDIRGFYTRSQLNIYPDTCIVFYPDGFMKFFDLWGIYEVEGNTIKANINFYQKTDLLTLYNNGIGIAIFEIEDSAHIVWANLKLLPVYSLMDKLNNFTSASAPPLKDMIDIDISKECSRVFRLVTTDTLPAFFSYPEGEKIKKVLNDMFDR